MQPSMMTVNDKTYQVKKLLGKGKGGYSYLVSDDDDQEYVLKQIHHEPCAYYQFGDKLKSELNDYQRLRQAGIRVPDLLAVDEAKERLLKQYIPGDTIYDLVAQDKNVEPYIDQLKAACRLLYDAKLNIDYFPTNFIVHKGLIWYIDFECNDYMDEWNFENWGIKYWSKTAEFIQYMNSHA